MLGSTGAIDTHSHFRKRSVLNGERDIVLYNNI